MKGWKHLDKEEQLNVLSHSIGVPLAIMGTFFLYRRNQNESLFSLFSIGLYCFSLCSMFLFSTLYHAAVNFESKKKLRILDHINIYFLIAGTYTPVALITLINENGWYIFGIVWGIALIGTVLKLFFTGKFEIVSLLLYLIMGWLIVLDVENLVALISDYQLQMLILGGMFYTIGIFFYVKDNNPYYHFIWHLFVLAGALSHWLFIYSLIK